MHIIHFQREYTKKLTLCMSGFRLYQKAFHDILWAHFTQRAPKDAVDLDHFSLKTVDMRTGRLVSFKRELSS